MKKLIIITLLSSLGVFAQTIDDLKKEDSIYFYFSSDEFQKKNILARNNFDNDTTMYYSYLKNKNASLISGFAHQTDAFLTFRFSKYKDFDAYFEKKETYHKYHEIGFLEDNRHKIINNEFLRSQKTNTSELLHVLQSKKLFVIDESEMKNNKIVVREVFLTMVNGLEDDCEDIVLFESTNISPFYYQLKNQDKRYIFIKPNLVDGTEDMYLLFEPSSNTYKDVYQYITQNGMEFSEPKIQEQYTLKLNLKNKVIFFQLTNKRKQKMELSKKYNFFNSNPNVISIEELNGLSEKQLVDLFSKTKNIYVIESSLMSKDFVIPKIAYPTFEINEFIEKNMNN